jgi:hypothetical protein
MGGVLIWESVRRERSGAYRNRGEGLYEVKKIGPFGKVGALWTILICRDLQATAMDSVGVPSFVSVVHVCVKIGANILTDFFEASSVLENCQCAKYLACWWVRQHIGWASKVYFFNLHLGGLNSI